MKTETQLDHPEDMALVNVGREPDNLLTSLEEHEEFGGMFGGNFEINVGELKEVKPCQQ